MSLQLTEFTDSHHTLRTIRRHAMAGATAWVLAFGAGVSTVVAAPGNGKGLASPNLSVQALNPGAPGMTPPGLQGIPNVVSSAALALAAPALPSVTATPPGISAAARTVPGLAAPSPGVQPSLPQMANGAAGPLMTGQLAMIRSASDSHGSAPVFTTGKGETMLATGKSVELVDPATPGLRVEIAAANGKALDLGAIMNGTGGAGIFAGLGGRKDWQGARRAIEFPDGRVILASDSAATTGKAVAADVLASDKVPTYRPAMATGAPITEGGNAPIEAAAATDPQPGPAGAGSRNIPVTSAGGAGAGKPRTCG